MIEGLVLTTCSLNEKEKNLLPSSFYTPPMGVEANTVEGLISTAYFE